MKIGIASDHRGYEIKNEIKERLQSKGYELIDYGTYSNTRVNYPEYAFKLCNGVLLNNYDFGIAICGTGIGVSITANKVKGIRCALCHDVFSAKATRAHNDTNMLAMGQRVIGEGLALEIVKAWLEGQYEGGRHDQRIAKMIAYEGEN